MNEHRFELPTQVDNAWNNVSERAQQILGNTALGNSSSANQLLHPELVLSPEIYSWLEQTLEPQDSISTFETWKQHEAYVGAPVPHNIHELAQNHPTFMATIARLYDAHRSLLALDEKADENIVGEDMTLVLVPWLAMSQAFEKDDWEDWADCCFEVMTTDESVFNYHQLVKDALSDNAKIYRHPDNPGKLLTPKAYLKLKQASDGPWGIMLMQTGNYPGMKRYEGRSAKQLTKKGKEHLYLEGHAVDALGIFEWWALSMQHGQPESLSSGSEASLLLANLIPRQDYKMCIHASWHKQDGISYLEGDPYGETECGNHDLVPRLAVA